MTQEPDPIRHPWPSDEGPWEITYRLGWIAGRPECIGLMIEALDGGPPQPLRSTELRELAHGFRADGSVLAGALDALGAERSNELADAAKYPHLTAYVQRQLRSKVRSGFGPEHYERVVATYLAGGSAPTRAVQDEFGVPYSTARSWVTAARRLGLLGQSGRGRVSGLADDQGFGKTDGEAD